MILLVDHSGGRFFFNRMDEGFDPDFLEGVRKEGVFIICSLLFLLYWVDNAAICRKSFFCAVFLHVLTLVISLLVFFMAGSVFTFFYWLCASQRLDVNNFTFPAIICSHSEWFN